MGKKIEKLEFNYVIANTDRAMANGIAGDPAHIISRSVDGNEISVLVMTHDGPLGPFKLSPEDIIEPFTQN